MADATFEERREKFNECNESLSELQTDLDEEMKEFETNSTEYKMFESLDNAATEMSNAYDLIISSIDADTDSTTEFALGLALAKFIDKADVEYRLFHEFRNELEIEIHNPKATLPNVLQEINDEIFNTGTDYNTTPVATKKTCEKCGIEMDANNYNSLCDHCLNYANCDDCGKERNIADMTLTGKTYHCGCADTEFYCEWCGTRTTVDKQVGGAFCSNECLDASMNPSCARCGISTEQIAEYDGHKYCYDCYNSIMTEVFGGPASEPLE